jgi:hypothetical protein
MKTALLIVYEMDLYLIQNSSINTTDLELITFSFEIAMMAKKNFYIDVKLINQVLPSAEVKLVHERSHTLAKKYDFELSKARRIAIPDEVPTVGWHYLRIYYAVQAVQKIFLLIAKAKQSIEDYDEICLLDSDKYFDFHNNSSFIKEIYGYSLVYFGLSVKKIGFNWSPEKLEKTLTIPQGEWKLIVHSPTIFYREDMLSFIADAARWKDENILSIESPSWNAHFFCNTAPLVTIEEAFSEPNHNPSELDLMNFYAPHRDALANMFDEQFPGSDIAKHSQFIDNSIKHERLQIGVFNQLVQSPHLKNCKAALVCEHDGGIQGPILSFAIMRQMRITLFPHSTIQTNPVIGNELIVRKSCRNDPHLDLDLGSGESIKQFAFIRRQQVRLQSNKILFLFNTTVDMYRINVLDFKDFEIALQDFISTFTRYGWQVGIRTRPGSVLPTSSFFSAGVNVINCSGDLCDWVDWPSHVCSLFSPTSALIRFWEMGCKCFHIQEIDLCQVEAATLPPREIEIISGDRFSSLLNTLAVNLIGNDLSGFFKATSPKDVGPVC